MITNVERRSAQRIRNSHHERELQRVRDWNKTPAGKASARYRYLRKKRRNKPAMQARRELRRAVQRGRIIKPKRCSICNTVGPVDGHHISYKPWHRLAVWWVCIYCHRVIHALGK